MQMILLRRNLGWIDQEDIAKEVGARIFPSAKKSFTARLKTTKSKKHVGLDMEDFVGKQMLSFFKKHKLPLKAQISWVSEIKDARKFIEENLSEKNDVMACFHGSYFDKKWLYGHYALIAALDGDKVTLCDPEKTHKSFWTTTVNKLIKAMSKQFDGYERGFVVFSNV